MLSRRPVGSSNYRFLGSGAFPLFAPGLLFISLNGRLLADLIRTALTASAPRVFLFFDCGTPVAGNPDI
jgi:hypothetical protein